MCESDCKIVQELKEKVKALEEELAKYKQPPKDSSNSSNPPSKDQKPNKYPGQKKSKRKSGGQKGHKGHNKFMVDNPDEIIPVLPKECPHCGSNSFLDSQKVVERRQEIEIPPIKPYVKEYQQRPCTCCSCGKRVIESFPQAISAPVCYGNTVAATISFLYVYGQLSYQRITNVLEALCNLKISEGTVKNKLEKTKETLKPTYDDILKKLQTSDYVGSDETGMRIDGKNGYVWVFQNDLLTYFHSCYSRGFKVIKQFFGEKFSGKWVSDRLAAQLKIKALHQLCLSHIIRDCKYVIEAEKSRFAKRLLILLYRCIDFKRKEKTCRESREDYKKQLSYLFSKIPPGKLAQKLFKGLVGRQKELLLFLDYPFLPFDNNGSERALRSVVTKRKVSNCFRTLEGAHCYDILASVMHTFRKQGLDIMDSLLRLFNNETILLQT